MNKESNVFKFLETTKTKKTQKIDFCFLNVEELEIDLKNENYFP